MVLEPTVTPKILGINMLISIIFGYADDTQMYISMPATDIPSTVPHLVQCIDDVSELMARNRSKMNTEKTQLIWLGTSQQLRKVSVTELTLPSGLIQFVNSVTNLGLHIDSELTMLPHIDSVCRTGFFQLRQLRTVRGSLTTECAQTMVHSLISSRVDYCNSLLFGISAERIKLSDCSPFRMQRRVWCQEHANLTASRLYCRTCHGYL